MNSVQVIMCAYVYANFFTKALLTILDEILMFLKGSGFKTLKPLFI